MASVANWASGEVWVVDPESPTELDVQDGIARYVATAGPESLASMIVMPIMYQVDVETGHVKVITDSDPGFLRFVMLLAQRLGARSGKQVLCTGPTRGGYSMVKRLSRDAGLSLCEAQIRIEEWTKHYDHTAHWVTALRRRKPSYR